MSKFSTNVEEVFVPKLTDDVLSTKLRTLQNLAVTYISNNPQVIFAENEQLEFHDGLYITSTLSEAIFHHLLHNPMHPTLTAEKLISLFSDVSKCCLHSCLLDNVEISSNSIYKLCSLQNVQHLELLNITFSDNNFDVSSLLKLCGEKLLSFHMRNVCPTPGWQGLHFHRCNLNSSLKAVKLSAATSWIFVASAARDGSMALVSLELGDVEFQEELFIDPASLSKIESQFVDPFSYVGGNELQPATHMMRDVMMVQENDADSEDIQPKQMFLYEPSDVNSRNGQMHKLLFSEYSLDMVSNTLLSLSLFDADIGDIAFKVVLQLKKLRHLDISSPLVGVLRRRKRPTEFSVWQILDELPDLASLDVSCTEMGDKLYIDGKLNDISGERCLRQTTKRKLDFLGLFESEGCEVLNIYSLADEVSGYHTEHQIMVSLERYQHRTCMLVPSFNHLYRLNRHHNITCPHRVLRLLLSSIHRFPLEEDLILTCTANLFFLTREHYMMYSTQQRNEMVLAIMHCLNKQKINKLVVRNVLLTLYHFEVPGDFIFQFGYVTRTLLSILVAHQNNSEIGVHAINLCNTMVSSMKHDMKSEVSQFGFVQTIMFVIEQRVESNTSDDMLQVLWSTLWNVTDETPRNSQIFIQCNGLDLIQRCFSQFTEIEICKNMMGLVGNIAEVKFLRPDLMNQGLLNRFHLLLTEENQNLEVAYNVAGTLSHLLSDGPEAWTCPQLQRDTVRQDMFNVIESWNIEASRNINYRSFHPILNLIYSDVPECVHWAVWALWNLSCFDSKYCNLLSKENGVEILNSVESRPVYEKTKKLAREIVERVKKYLSEIQAE